jgi:hypothetical protein
MLLLQVLPCNITADDQSCLLKDSTKGWPALDWIMFSAIDNPPPGAIGRHLSATDPVAKIRITDYDSLVLPENSQSMASTVNSASCGKTQVVVSGDTCYSIYTAAGITSDEFYSLNPGINCNALQVGACSGDGGTAEAC